MDWVLDKVVDQSDCGASVGNTKITDLVFADDAVIFAESLEVLVMALEALHEEAKPLGLEVSWLKTKVQIRNVIKIHRRLSEDTGIPVSPTFTANHVPALRSKITGSNVMACERRSTDVVWLLEKSPTSSFPGNRLPLRGEVLQVFLFHHKIQKEVLFAAAASTAEKVLEVWRRANIPTSDVSWVKKKILKLYEEYGALAKSKSRKTEMEEMKRCIFRDSLEDMFDIAHSKAMEAKIPEENKAFLEAQREDRQSCSMAGVDEKLKRATEEKRRKRQRMEEKKKDAAASSSTLDRDVALESSTTSSSSNEETEDDDFKAPTSAKCPRRRPPKENKLTKELTLAWERDNLSIRAATSSYAAAAMSLGKDERQTQGPKDGRTNGKPSSS
ncbi:hypothetical protein GWK47_011852 [Chionoecetes opilio]|uniref:Reverse transcriptase domain-containing protein n=1 Tax=Chionoecetes opilio TaxID=41210 RepID=A0A8J4XVI6_CHIOP|nr:hypothetical protein GWK47_011852 [Chionoecetes opilio]